MRVDGKGRYQHVGRQAVASPLGEGAAAPGSQQAQRYGRRRRPSAGFQAVSIRTSCTLARPPGLAKRDVVVSRLGPFSRCATAQRGRRRPSWLRAIAIAAAAERDGDGHSATQRASATSVLGARCTRLVLRTKHARDPRSAATLRCTALSLCHKPAPATILTPHSVHSLPQASSPLEMAKIRASKVD